MTNTLVTRASTTTLVDTDSRTSLAVNLTRGGTVVTEEDKGTYTIGTDGIFLTGTDENLTISTSELTIRIV